MSSDELNIQQPFNPPLTVGQINLPDEEDFETMFRGIFERRHYANHGPLVHKFEDALAQELDIAHVVCVTNGTLALMVMLRALRIQGEVIVPSFTFPATVQAVLWAGLTPVFADVELDTHCLSQRTVEACITPNTSAILGVHLWGRACDPDGLQELALKHSLKLVYDSAHAMGCTHLNRSMSSFGLASIYSFHATKVLNCAEGGCIATNDDELADLARTIRNFHNTATYEYAGIRINGKMSEAQAAMGLLSLNDLETNIKRNFEIYSYYQKCLADIPGLSLLQYPAGDQNNYQYLVLQIEAESFGMNADDLQGWLLSRGVLARRYFKPGVHRINQFTKNSPAETLQNTEHLCTNLLQLPNANGMAHSQVRQVSDLIRRMQLKTTVT